MTRPASCARSDVSSRLDVDLTTPDGVVIAAVKCAALGAEFAVSGLTFSGDHYAATVTGEKGTTTLSVTTSNAGKTLVGTIVRTPIDGSAVGGSFSLQKM